MEDKSLERSAEELASGLGMGVLGGRPEDREWLIRETTRALKLYAKQENAALQARLDLRSDYVKQTDAQIDEQAEMITTLQFQITALKQERDDARNGNKSAVSELTNAWDEIAVIKELLNGASLHPETGVSLVDDVRDLVKELARCKNSVPGSIKSYIAQVEHEKKEAAKLKAENSRLRELINEASGMMKLLDRKGQYESVTDWLAKAALDGTK